MMWSIYFYLKQLFRHYIIFFLLVRILVLGHLLGYSSMNYLGVPNIFISFEAIKLALIGAVKLDSWNTLDATLWLYIGLYIKAQDVQTKNLLFSLKLLYYKLKCSAHINWKILSDIKCSCFVFATSQLGMVHAIWPAWMFHLMSNKDALTAAFNLACLEIRSRNEEAINSTRNRT